MKRIEGAQVRRTLKRLLRLCLKQNQTRHDHERAHLEAPHR
jgi:hypothetical protein